MSLFETTALAVGGVTDGPVAEAAKTRTNIMDATQAAENAVLRPLQAGGIPHDLRAALAARIAAAGGMPDLAARYAEGAGDMAALADGASNGMNEGLGHIVAFTDKVANQTRDIAAEDIAGLQSAGVSDADIVRLCELTAFVAYQLRVVAGLKLMGATA
ncbi:hypothetical protein GCM10011415_04750 [Salipiger pallidus]|uniref:CMD domain protein, Avi_7170 family n=1 Tax=Salipiger pallidus TaxID=1775170 RepID=A0A8J2ZGK6_9RHOB|nr:hypothetical protein [Salipiger pallidus]GGG61661.1 hypothetical protein GCM10011415_04750 [Salipiger pallidus]